jgi:hypothetical protein
MKIPPVYSLFCLLVLGVFIYAKYQGLDLFSSGATSQTHNTGGSHYTGVFIGSHK